MERCVWVMQWLLVGDAVASLVVQQAGYLNVSIRIFWRSSWGRVRKVVGGAFFSGGTDGTVVC